MMRKLVDLHDAGGLCGCVGGVNEREVGQCTGEGDNGIRGDERPTDHKDCPACTARMRYHYGVGIGYDEWVCHNCGNEIELGKTTYPEDWE